ncbi:cytochrome P450 [Streptomyces sp. RFCAC02]|uniref:cytochrome P450 n=1 Tax=Streptomyces sp. RFCAC02 TaxID=2499143 RepID=UPI0010207A5F|nr:cytochrome P450 [Streptomyces sp. RFCAC02]
MPQCPEPLAFPFPDTAAKLAPHPRYAELRERPLVRVRMPYGDDTWLATRHADVRQVLSDPRFSMVPARGQDQPRVRPGARAGDGLFSLDPPEHSEVRAVIGRHFTPRRLEGLAERVRAMANGLFDRMAETGSPADFFAAYARPLPTMVICDLLGVAADRHEWIWDWANGIMNNTTTPDEMAARYGDFLAFLRGEADRRRTHPGDDLLTTLVQALDAGRITERRFHALVADLIGAGFVTTAAQLANFLLTLFEHPDQLALLRDDPRRADAAVEELMRFVPVLSSISLPRYATEDVELGGVTVSAGDPIIVSLVAANHDPSVHPDPGRLDIERETVAHLGFGHGPHYCIGAQLARIEMRVSLELLFTRFPAVKPACDLAELPWLSGFLINCPEELPIAW